MEVIIKLIIRVIENKFTFSFMLFLISIFAVIATGVDYENGHWFFKNNELIKSVLWSSAVLGFVGALIILIIASFEYTGKRKKFARGSLALIKRIFNSQEEVVDAFVRDTSLDYLAYYKNGLVIERYNPRIGQELLAQGINNSVNDQIAEYSRIGRDLFNTIDHINEDFKDLKQNVLVRVVLDVKKGGIFYYHIDDDTSSYLVGATINQDNMEDGSADQIMKNVSIKLERFK